jgi:hypothetical protein
LADDAGRIVQAKLAATANQGADFVKERPIAAAAGAGTAIALLAGRPALRILKTLFARSQPNPQK